MIYLVLTDGWLESAVTRHYAKTKDEMFQILREYYQDINMQTDQFSINEKKKEISFVSKFEWEDDTDWSKCISYYLEIPKINR